MSDELKTAYPLAWPIGEPRTRSRQRAKFDRDLSLAQARDELLHEVKLIGGSRPILSTDLRLRNDGLPASGQAQPKDPGVAIYFTRKGKAVAMSSDRFDKIEHNMRALARSLAAMRGIERWGSSSLLDRAFIGLTALPAPPQDSWETVLGVHRDWRLDAIEEKYREKMRTAHPDAGGSTALAQKLNAAIAAARAAKGAA